MDRIFSIVPDRSQIFLYEKHGLCFVTTVFEICLAYVYCDGVFEFTEACFHAPAHPVKFIDFFQRKFFFWKIGGNTDLGSIIKANTYYTEFNIVIHAVFIKKIKIGRRLKYGIGVRIPPVFLSYVVWQVLFLYEYRIRCQANSSSSVMQLSSVDFKLDKKKTHWHISIYLGG